MFSDAAIIAVAEAVKASAEFLTEVVKGQPASVKKEAWDRWNEHQQFWHDIFKPKM